MKWYSHALHKKHLNDIKVQRGDEIEMYYPYVIQIANTFARDSVAIGALNFQDLVQSGYVGLVEGWAKLDHDRDQPEKWSFLKKRIKWAIRREIDNHGAAIKIPRVELEESRRNLTSIDKLLVNSFPKFFKEIEPANEVDITPYAIDRLSLIIDDYLYSNFKNIDHVEILKALFGIDREKKSSIKDLAQKYNMSDVGIKKIRERMIKKLRNEKFEKIIENFYEDWYTN